MKAHVDALRALLTPLGYPVHYIEPPDSPPMPYLLIWGSAGTPGTEQAVDDVRTDIDTLLGVTAVAGTPDGVLIVGGNVRGVLAPDGQAVTLLVPGRQAVLRLFDSRAIDTDKDVTITATGKHPAFGADVYRLISTPT